MTRRQHFRDKKMNRGGHANMARLLGLVLLFCVIAIGLFAATGLGFYFRTMPSRAKYFPTNAVVFTGQFDRVFAGLDLLRQGRVENLFISGVNIGAGIPKERFPTQFALDANLRGALASGRLALGEWAENTFENAAETASWYEERGLSGPVLLITSCLHMPRASLALERAMPKVSVVRMCLATAAEDIETDAPISEFAKFIMTLAVAPRAGAAFIAGGDGRR
jgi:uncharacterized SAM-binding protein YcdF (DUF218 family)